MPQAIDLIVKNAAAVDKTFSLISPAAGDGAVAEWALQEGTISSVFPRLTSSAKKTKDGRSLHLKFYTPSSFTDAVTGLTNVGSRAEWNVNVAIPANFPEAKKDEVLAFGTNILRHALIQAMMRGALGAN